MGFKLSRSKHMHGDKTKQVVNRHEFIFNLEATKTNQLLEQSLGLILGPYNHTRRGMRQISHFKA